MQSILKKAGALLVLALVIAPLAGCDDDDDTNGPMLPEGSSLRVVHASPDAPPVDIYVNDQTTPLIEDLDYGEASAYLTVDPAAYTVQIRGAGALPTTDPVFEIDLTVPDGVRITAVASGLLAGKDETTEFRVLPLVEDFAAPGGGNAAVRILHAGADAPTVALDVGNDGVPEVPALARFADTGASGVALPAGTALTIGVWAGEPLARVTVFTTPALPEGGEVFVIATGLLGQPAGGDDGFRLLAVASGGSLGFIPQDAPAVVYALHASPDAPSVDVYSGDAELIDDLGFAELAGPLSVPPGSYDLSFRDHGTGGEAAVIATPSLAAGQKYLAIATGFLTGSPGFTLLPLGDGFAAAGEALVRAVHVSPDAPEVDLGVLDGGFTPVFTGLSFGEASAAAGTDVGVASFTLGVVGTGTTEPIVASFDLQTSAGLKAFAVAAGSLTGDGESFRLILVNTATSPWTSGVVLPN
jgi:hypothetical protein